MRQAFSVLLAVALIGATQLLFGAALGHDAAQQLALLPAIIGVGARLLGGKAVKKAASWVAGRVAGSGAARTVGTVAGTVGATIGRYPVLSAGTIAGAGATLMPSLNPFGPQGGSPTAPQPREGVVGRTISRILPGGMTGREWMPFEGTEIDKYGRPIAVYPAAKEVAVAPPGYVIVTVGDTRIAMLRQAAIAMGLWKAPPKPPISGWDARAIRRAASATKRVKKLAQKVGFNCSKKGRGGKC